MSEIAKHGEIIKAEFDIFALRNTRGQRVDHKGTTNAKPGQSTFKQR